MADEQLASTLARKFRVDVLDTTGTAAPVTATAANDTFTAATAHGLTVGDAVLFTAGVSGITPGQTYYVKTVGSATTFIVSAISSTGAALDLSSDITSGQTFKKVIWRQVRAIAELQPKVDNTMQDDSDYDSDGWKSSAKTALEWSLELTLNRKQGVASKQYDPGQEILRIAGESFGAASVVPVRWYDRFGGPEAYMGYGSVEYNPDGGGMDALATAKATIHGNGARSPIANPAPVA